MHHGKRVAVLFLVPLAVGLLSQESTFAQASLRLGTWKLNLAKSTYAPGPPPKSEVRTYTANGDGLANAVDRIEADGSHTTIHWAAHFDGKDNPYSGSPIYDTIAITPVDVLTFSAIQKKSGKVIANVKNAVSRDGQTLTVTVNGTDASGKPQHNVMVFDKQ